MNSLQQPSIHRRGSVYLITLITVGAIATMILIGVTLRGANRTSSTMIEGIALSNASPLDATEIALQTIVTDPAWKVTAQSGTVFGKMEVSGSVYLSSVTDADTDGLPTDETTNYRLKLKTHADLANSVVQIDLSTVKTDYPSLLKGLTAEFYWPLNDPLKSSRADEQFDGQDGAYKSINTPASSTNDEGALVPVFANSNDHIEVPWNSKFKQNTGSIAMWIKYTGTANLPVASPFAGINYKSGGNPTLNLAVYNSAIWAYVDDRGDYEISHALSTPVGGIRSNAWHHIALTWGDYGLAIYIDGVRRAYDSSNREGVDTTSFLFGGQQPLNIGAGYNMFTSGTPKVGFRGSVAHVVYFDSYLSASEVEKLASVKPDEIYFSIVDDSWVVLFNE